MLRRMMMAGGAPAPSAGWLSVTLADGAFYCADGAFDSSGRLIDHAPGARSVVVPQFSPLPSGGPQGGPAAVINAMAGQTVVSTDADFGMKHDNWTIEVWLYFNSTITARWIEWMGGQYDNSWAVKGYGTSSLDAYIAGRKTVGGASISSPVNAGVWIPHHWVFASSGPSTAGELRSYVSGALVNTSSGILGRMAGVPRFGYGGSDGSYVSPPAGYRMSRIALYKKALTAGEIAARAAMV